MDFWLSPAVSTRDPVINPESFSSRDDNGRGSMLRAMNKMPCYNLFIAHSRPLFQKIVMRNSKSIKIENYAKRLILYVSGFFHSHSKSILK